MVISVVYLLVRCLLGCLMTLTWRQASKYLLHYNTARPHRFLGQLTPVQVGSQPPELISLADHRIRQKQVLGGLTREYYAALPLRVAAGKRRWQSPGSVDTSC